MENNWKSVDQRRLAKKATDQITSRVGCGWTQSLFAQLNTVDMVSEEMVGKNTGEYETWGWKPEIMHVEWGSSISLLCTENPSY